MNLRDTSRGKYSYEGNYKKAIEYQSSCKQSQCLIVSV